MATVLTPTAAVDVVAVLRQSDMRQVFAKARPMNALINEGGDLMEHPLESGAQITDHLVRRLTDITMPVLIRGDYRPVLDEIRQLYVKGTLLSVQTKSGVYSDMAIYDLPHEETTDAFDAITITLKLREARFIKATLAGPVSSARHPKQAATTKRGQVQAKPATQSQGSFLFRHFGKLGQP